MRLNVIYFLRYWVKYTLYGIVGLYCVKKTVQLHRSGVYSKHIFTQYTRRMIRIAILPSL